MHSIVENPMGIQTWMTFMEAAPALPTLIVTGFTSAERAKFCIFLGIVAENSSVCLWPYKYLNRLLDANIYWPVGNNKLSCIQASMLVHNNIFIQFVIMAYYTHYPTNFTPIHQINVCAKLKKLVLSII